MIIDALLKVISCLAFDVGDWADDLLQKREKRRDTPIARFERSVREHKLQQGK